MIRYVTFTLLTILMQTLALDLICFISVEMMIQRLTCMKKSKYLLWSAAMLTYETFCTWLLQDSRKKTNIFCLRSYLFPALSFVIRFRNKELLMNFAFFIISHCLDSSLLMVSEYLLFLKYIIIHILLLSFIAICLQPYSIPGHQLRILLLFNSCPCNTHNELSPVHHSTILSQHCHHQSI